MFHFTTSKNFQSFELSANMIRLPQHLLVDDSPGFEVAEIIEIDHCDAPFKSCIIKTAFGQTADERHLPSLEAESNASPRAGFLALVTFAAGFSVTRTFAGS